MNWKHMIDQGIWAGMIFGGTAVQTLILAIITIRCDWEKEVVFQWRLAFVFLLLLSTVQQYWWSLSPLLSSLIYSTLLTFAGRESKPACIEVVRSNLKTEVINFRRSCTSSACFKGSRCVGPDGALEFWPGSQDFIFFGYYGPICILNLKK